MTIVEHNGSGYVGHGELEINEGPFWPAAIEILQEHQTDILKDRVLQIANNAQNVNKSKVEEIIKVLDTAYSGKKRKFTDEAEINHAYQVALLTALTVGTQNIHHDTFVTALAHDLDENTALTSQQITDLTNTRIYGGIDALSHKTNQVDIYPQASDKKPYFADLLIAERDDPSLQLLTIKIMDQIAVSNGPVTKEELKNKSRQLRKRWNTMTRKKVGEMTLLHSMLRPQESQQEAQNAQTLSQGIHRAEQRLDSTIGPKLGKIFQGLRLGKKTVK